MYVIVKIKIGKDGDWSTTRAVKTGAANFKLSEDQDNKLLLHFPGVEKGERATVVVQAWEARSGAPDELLGTNTVDISKIIGESSTFLSVHFWLFPCMNGGALITRVNRVIRCAVINGTRSPEGGRRKQGSSR